MGANATPSAGKPPPERAASSSGSDREPSRLAAHEDTPGCLDSQKVGETAQFHENMLAMNEALMVGSVRQHDLTDAANSLNARLQAEIVERTQVEAALLAARTELAQANAELEQKVLDRTASLQETVAELEHFSYTITHDMRAPLRAMYSLGGVLMEECTECLKPSRLEYIRQIVDAAERMDKLITDALQYSGVVRQHFEPEPVDADTLLRGMLESYPEFQPPHANIRIDGHLPVVLGNQAGLTQCFSNLLANAVKFVYPDQIPEVRVWAESVQSQPTEESAVGHAPRTTHHESDPATLNPKSSPLNQLVRIWFEDKGIGIEKQYHDKIWQMFQQLNKTYEGTGIGLALVRKVVDRLGGKVGVESEPGHGSRFWIELKPANGQPPPKPLTPDRPQ